MKSLAWGTQFFAHLFWASSDFILNLNVLILGLSVEAQVEEIKRPGKIGWLPWQMKNFSWVLYKYFWNQQVACAASELNPGGLVPMWCRLWQQATFVLGQFSMKPHNLIVCSPSFFRQQHCIRLAIYPLIDTWMELCQLALYVWSAFQHISISNFFYQWQGINSAPKRNVSIKLVIGICMVA